MKFRGKFRMGWNFTRGHMESVSCHRLNQRVLTAYPDHSGLALTTHPRFTCSTTQFEIVCGEGDCIFLYCIVLVWYYISFFGDKMTKAHIVRFFVVFVVLASDVGKCTRILASTHTLVRTYVKSHYLLKNSCVFIVDAWSAPTTIGNYGGLDEVSFHCPSQFPSDFHSSVPLPLLSSFTHTPLQYIVHRYPPLSLMATRGWQHGKRSLLVPTTIWLMLCRQTEGARGRRQLP